MPAAAVYVLAIVGTVAAGIAFKEFVYDPHIAPKFHQWTDEIRARREARRRGGVLVPVPVDMSERRRRRDGSFSDSEESDSEDGDKKGNGGEYELETLSRSASNRTRKTSSNVEEWRVGVNSATLRRRNTRNIAQESMIPTHILSSPSSLSPSLSSGSSSNLQQKSSPAPPPQVSSPSLPTASNRDSLISSSTFGPSPAPGPSSSTLINLSPSDTSPNDATSRNAVYNSYLYGSPSLVPSLSLSHPVDPSDAEQGLELVSPPSSRPDSPFSNFSTFSEVSRQSEMGMNNDRTNFVHVGSMSSVSSGSAVRVEPPPSLGQTFNGDYNTTGRSYSSTTTTPRYLTREEIQRLIDTHAPNHSQSQILRSNSNSTSTMQYLSPQPQSHAQTQTRMINSGVNPSASPTLSESSYASFASFGSPSASVSASATRSVGSEGEYYFTPPMTVGARSTSLTPSGNGVGATGVAGNRNGGTRTTAMTRSPLLPSVEREVYHIPDSDDIFSLTSPSPSEAESDGESSHQLSSHRSVTSMSASLESFEDVRRVRPGDERSGSEFGFSEIGGESDTESWGGVSGVSSDGGRRRGSGVNVRAPGYGRRR